MGNADAILERRIPVDKEFEELFTHFYVAKNVSPDPVSKTLIPHFQTMMVFSFGSEILLTTNNRTKLVIGRYIVLGPVNKPLDYTLTPGADMLVVNFKADAFYRFFGQAIIEQQTAVHPDALVHKNCFENLWNDLNEIDSPDQR